jgi:putative hydrolase of the HAD superfamily
MRKAILFDLGNTLVRYFTRAEWPPILEQSIADVQALLDERGLLSVSTEEIGRRVAEENHEAEDCRVRPLDGRLCRIFGLDVPHALAPALCRAYLRATFEMAYVYEDTIPVLKTLRERGIRTAVVSNSPFGSPPEPWHEELQRLGIAQHVDLAVFCGEVGWRKPARPIFDHVMDRLGGTPEECLFVGDHPKWDIAGARWGSRRF